MKSILADFKWSKIAILTHLKVSELSWKVDNLELVDSPKLISRKIWMWSMYLFTFKNMTYHFWSRTDHLNFFSILRHYSPPGHYHQKVTNISDVWNASQGMIHHNLLQKRGKKWGCVTAFITLRVLSIVCMMIFV